jgi:hypothetical protein
MHGKQSRERGRPRGMYPKFADYKSLEYIGLILVKHKLDPTAFFNSLVEAWKTKESTCENLTIECRTKTQDNAVFLITEGIQVVAQLPITKQVLTNTNPIEQFAHIKRIIEKTLDTVETKHLQIKDLKVGMKRINLEVKILEISKPNTVYTRQGKLNLVANAKVTDESGTIDLPLWNRQVDSIAVGDIIQIENANIVSFRGGLQLRITRTGKISIIGKD